MQIPDMITECLDKISLFSGNITLISYSLIYLFIISRGVFKMYDVQHETS